MPAGIVGSGTVDPSVGRGVGVGGSGAKAWAVLVGGCMGVTVGVCTSVDVGTDVGATEVLQARAKRMISVPSAPM